MLTQVTYQNFKALRDVEIALEQMTVLVGPNGIGKSTALDGLAKILGLLKTIDKGNLNDTDDNLFGKGWVDAHHWFSPNRSSGVSLSITANPLGRFLWAIKNSDNKITASTLQMPNGETADFTTDMYPPRSSRFTQGNDLKSLPVAHRLRLDPEALASPSPAATGHPEMTNTGQGLATLLAHLAVLRDGSLERIEEQLQRLVPDFRRIFTPSVEVQETEASQLATKGASSTFEFSTRKVGGFKLELEFDKIGRIPAAHVSEGTLLGLGLLTFLHMHPASLILMDDVERGLHPGAQQRLIEIFSAILATTHKDCQMVLTTHSPDLIDACKPEQVRVFGRDSLGDVKVRRLEDHPEASKWLKMVRAGEFWSTVGEDWLGEFPEQASGHP